MTRPWKEVRVYQHTETVYFNGRGVEVAREDNGDSVWYDTEDSVDLTDREIEDYIG